MRLLKPNPGECCDRQTILELKMAAGEGKKINTSHFVAEHGEIQSYLERDWFRLADEKIQEAFDELLSQLRAVNARLWQLEDAMRAAKRDWDRNSINLQHNLEQLNKVREVAFAIAEQNDIRASLVAKINALFGIDFQEKMYS